MGDHAPAVVDARPRDRKKRRAPVWTHPALYTLIRAATTMPQVAGMEPSMRAAAALGRAFGAARFNRNRVDRATERVRFALPHFDRAGARELVLASYEHLCRVAIEIGFIPRLLNDDGWIQHVGFGSFAGSLDAVFQGRPLLMLTGHVGNWEVLGYTMAVLGFPMHVVYRPLDMKPLDQWVRRTRAKRGLTLLDKFGVADELPRLIDSGIPIGFVADQNAGDKGLFVPFFGRLTSTYKTIGLLAIRHRTNVVCSMARRMRPGEETLGWTVGVHGLCYQIDIVDVIRPEDWESRPDPLFYLTARYRHALQKMVEAAPEQYLWMHRIWKSRPRHEKADQPVPPALREKLRSLDWLTEADVEAICEQSERDRRYLAEQGLSRLP
ncbi:MAG: lysophospholipid acyltransferase family protein [Phycisphaerales bacterium]|nr:lysophospholipid acyltransferase family protein [Phycisphaerales bacterium]